MRYEVFSNNNAVPLRISSIGFSGDTNVTKFGPGQRNLYIIHYVTKGRGYYNGNVVEEGQGFLIYPGQSEEYYADRSNPWEFLWIISPDEGMKEVFSRYNFHKNSLVFDYNSVMTLKKLYNEIIFNNGKVIDSLQLLELFLQILNSHIFNHIPEQHKSNSEIYLEFCAKYIQTNMHQRITVEDLQSLTGVSQPYLHKIFKDKFNMSTKQYIIWSKMTRAKELLIKTDMTITEIANSVGYSDILAFSKAFTRNEKMSPQKYREKFVVLMNDEY